MAGFGGRLVRGRAKQITLLGSAAAAIVIVFLGQAQASIFDDARATLSDWTSPVLAAMRAPLVAFESWVGGATGIFSVYRENAELRRENAELRKWQNVALSLESRMHSYEKMLNVAPDPAVKSVTARVIGESDRPFVRTMILNAGKDSGIAKGQAVLDDRGLLGRIYVTGARTSWVILLTDLDSRVPVIVEPGHRRAILVGDNTPAPQLELDIGDGPVKPGDKVLSTADGGMLPADVPVGMVMEDGADLRVTLLAIPETADFVHVLDYAVPSPPSPGADPPGATASIAPSAAATRAPVAALPASSGSKHSPSGPSPDDAEEDR